MRRVVVTGLGLVTPVGADVETAWAALTDPDRVAEWFPWIRDRSGQQAGTLSGSSPGMATAATATPAVGSVSRACRQASAMARSSSSNASSGSCGGSGRGAP